MIKHSHETMDNEQNLKRLHPIKEKEVAKEIKKSIEKQAALDYHEFPRAGKLEIRATKPMANGRDLSRAYSPGVAEACLEIEKNPDDARRYTSRGNLVAVISNGTAVLGLGLSLIHI